MKSYKTNISDLVVFEPTIYGDDRGFFFESYNRTSFENAIGKSYDFVQDNHSRSSKGVLRGLHFQHEPYSQGKLVRCVMGQVFDVAVDIRPESADFGKWFGILLSAENKKQLWIPEGFAHGFLTLSDHAEFVYKATNYYTPTHEDSILWNDAEIGIEWPINDVVLSDKDKKAKKLSEILKVRKNK
ncbi:dTDP-4-dehydrorhamnose 3,5-epimerase [Buttiauxella sp. B2]|uniref:dTDP-4-dehydrorhamnose 3,5-epimerase n=1 Tax=Buttiauxella sp. B2 TaxID=2587812 RepID=UPI0011221A9C|nr:dTDP-4-dehydrorhamnose 3,5-epimerase [Buttiauxella sp. B2]TNV18997.1 dTDP-4-dehydrorhamnose 3,5-epimerase [Buttiauxella sp. B2]